MCRLEILQWQGKLDVAALRTDQNAGVERPAPRSPMNHYHQVDQWFQPDATNGCTLSGCHEPLPHDRKAKVPAFANFHATFLACKMCHEPQPHRSTAHWINTDTGHPQETPAILQLLSYLETNAGNLDSQSASANGPITSPAAANHHHPWRGCRARPTPLTNAVYSARQPRMERSGHPIDRATPAARPR